MAKIVTAYNNFSRGKIDHDMMGRFDLPIYRSGSDLFENFFSNFKGNAIYRPGFEDVLGEFQDCSLHEFKFRNDQNYIMVFFENKVRFLSYADDGSFGWVESSPSVILEVTTPWTLEQARTLQFTQNKDVVVVTDATNSVAPQDITRVSATSFTIAAHVFDADPFAGEHPASCLFYKGRLYFANTPSLTNTVWASEAGDFTVFTIPTTVTDISPLQFSIAEIAQPIEWLFGGENSLIAGCADGLVTINGGGVGVAIKADTIEADLSPTDGSNNSIPFSKDGLVFYVGKNARNIYYFSYDLLTESFNATDANFISYDITKGGIGKIRHKKDRNDLIYGIRGDGVLVSLNFNQDEKIVGWHDQRTTNGLIKDQAVITDNDGNPQLFVLVNRDGAFFIERQADVVEFSQRVDFFTGDEELDDEAHTRMVAEELNQCIYLDNSLMLSDLQESNTITFSRHGSSFSDDFSLDFGFGISDGTITAASAVFSSGDVGKHISYKTETGYESGRFRIVEFLSTTSVEVEILQEPSVDSYDNWYLSFNTLSGLTQYIGNTIGVVSDGGFLDEFEITEDTLELGSEVLNVVVGYIYRGAIKSFALGFQINANNTQTTMKAISRVGMRTVSSAGGKFGSTPYRLAPLQKLKQGDLNYLPPLPIDGTEYLTYVDNNELDKYFYVVQNEPLPLNITSVFLEANYTVQS